MDRRRIATTFPLAAEYQDWYGWHEACNRPVCRRRSPVHPHIRRAVLFRPEIVKKAVVSDLAIQSALAPPGDAAAAQLRHNMVVNVVDVAFLSNATTPNEWRLVTDVAHEVTVRDNTFTITAANSATLCGTVITHLTLQKGPAPAVDGKDDTVHAGGRTICYDGRTLTLGQ